MNSFARLSSLFLGLCLAAVAPSFAADGTPPAGKQTYFFLVFSDAAAGQEAEYNRWYNDEHGPDVTSIPGFVSGQRFIYAPQQLREVPLKKPKYLILYTVVTDDPVAVRAEIGRRAQNGQTRQSPTITNVKMYTYRSFRPPMRGAGGEAKDAKAGAKKTYAQVVFGDAVKGMDDAFNTWYDQTHEPELLATPGFTLGQRGIISEVQLAPTDEGPTQSKYLALFEMRTADLPAMLKGIKGSEPIPAFDRERTFGYTYEAIGPAMDGDRIRAERKRAGK